MCPFSEVHRIGPGDFKYFTRNNIDFGPRGYDVLDRLFTQRLAGSRCVLEGELVIWNKATKRFVPFGGTPSTLKLLKNTQNIVSYHTTSGSHTYYLAHYSYLWIHE